MDISLIIGIVIGAFLVVNGIGLDKLGNFWDPPSIFITVGGTFAAILASFPIRVLKKIPQHFKVILGKNKYKPLVAIDTIVELANIARRNGMIVLEDKANELKDPFLKNGVLLIVDALDGDKIRSILEAELENTMARHDEAAAIYDKGSALAPAFGMIGTLVGLVNMLKSMSETGSDSLGKDMSVALITTFYGTVLANLIFSPIANKLRGRNEEEVIYKQIVIEGILSIQSGDNPRFIKEKLLTFIANKERIAAKKKGDKSGGAAAQPAPADKSKK